MKTKHTEGVMEVRGSTGTILCIGEKIIADCDVSRTATQEDQANAARLALAWNLHDELVGVLQKVLAICPDQNLFRANLTIAHELRELNSELRFILAKSTKVE